MEENSNDLGINKKEEVLEQATKIFMRYGLKSVTMDDISKELKISKKTLYKFVTDKNDLVAQVMLAYTNKDQIYVGDLIKNSKTAIDEILTISEYVGAKMNNLHPSIHYDMEKYYPEAWEIFSGHKKNYVMKCITENLMRGIKEGIYRKDLNVPIVATIYVSRIDMAFDGQLFPPGDFNFRDVYMEMMMYHLRGIASEKGIKNLNEKFNIK